MLVVELFSVLPDFQIVQKRQWCILFSCYLNHIHSLCFSNQFAFYKYTARAISEDWSSSGDSKEDSWQDRRSPKETIDRSSSEGSFFLRSCFYCVCMMC